MKILFIYDSLSDIGGGSQIFSLDIFKKLVEKKHVVKLVTTKKIFSIDSSIPKDQLILVPEINLEAVYPVSIGSPVLSSTLKKQLHQFSPDVVHFHEPSPLSVRLAEYTARKGIPIVSHFHTDHKKIRTSKFPQKLFINKYGISNHLESAGQQRINEFSNKIICPTTAFSQEIDDGLKNKTIVLPNAISPAFFSDFQINHAKPKKLLTVSRLEKQKRLFELLDIMKQVKSSFTLSIYGSGLDEKKLKKYAKEQGLSDAVSFYGWVSHKKLPQVMANHDLFITPSDFETFGLTYVEALASGLPCFVYDYETTREVIPNTMAYFFSNFDPKNWSDKLLELQDQPKKYVALQESIKDNYHLLRKYHLDYYVDELIAIDTKIHKIHIAQQAKKV